MRTRIVLLTSLLLMVLLVVACDDDNPTEPTNIAPVIANLFADPATVALGLTTSVTCIATDVDNDDLSYTWSATAGTISGSTRTETWTAPITTGDYSITCSVSDGKKAVTRTLSVTVFEAVVPGAMVLIQGGTISMGDAYGEGNQEELPVHSISVSSFEIGKFEVTQAEWAEHMTAATYGFGSGDQHPVYYASWFEIIKYCNYKSIDEGLTPCYMIAASTFPSDWPDVPVYSTDTSFAIWNDVQCNWSANGYRLPTEAEWEFAARGGNNSADNYRYSGGQTVVDVAWFGDNAPDGTQPIGTKLPNQLGLYDMSGNLYEFCWDWYGENYYTTCNNVGTVTNPAGESAGEMRIVKGGSFGGDAANCRVAGRFRDYPVSQFSHTGFRLVKKPQI